MNNLVREGMTGDSGPAMAVTTECCDREAHICLVADVGRTGTQATAGASGGAGAADIVEEAGETGEQLAMARTREYNAALRARPHDLQLWLDFAGYQDELASCACPSPCLRLLRPRTTCSSGSTSRATRDELASCARPRSLAPVQATGRPAHAPTRPAALAQLRGLPGRAGLVRTAPVFRTCLGDRPRCARARTTCSSGLTSRATRTSWPRARPPHPRSLARQHAAYMQWQSAWRT